MDVRYTPEQDALRESAELVVSRLAPRTVRDLDDGVRTAKLDAAVQATGWRELRAAGENGRPAASGVEVAIVAEALGRSVADVSFVGPVLASELRRLAGAAPADGRETVILGTDLSGLAGPGAGSEVGAVAFDASGCDSGLVVFGHGPTFGLATVPVGSGGAHVDLTRTMSAVQLEGAVAVEGELDESSLQVWTALGLATACADLVGIMSGAVDMAREYAMGRQQYGAPIGSFQAVQHMLADAFVAMEGSRSAARYAAWSVDALAVSEAVAAASVAKAYCARAARDACETAIQVHGGIGNTWECLAHVYLRRALTSADLLGGVGPSLARVLDHAGIGGRRGLC